MNQQLPLPICIACRTTAAPREFKVLSKIKTIDLTSFLGFIKSRRIDGEGL
jgi:hypothetical protein